MWRKLFSLCSAVSLLLCAAACVLWARSLGQVEGVLWAGGWHDLTCWSWSGCFGATVTIGDGPSRPENTGLQHWRQDDAERLYSFVAPPVTPGPGRSGFGLHIEKTVAGGWLRGGYPIVSVFAPYWFLATVFGVLPLQWLRGRLTRGQRRRRGLCGTCGYDLRATRDRCPECGAVPGARATTAAA